MDVFLNTALKYAFFFRDSDSAPRYLVVRMTTGDNLQTYEVIPRAWLVSNTECLYPKSRRLGCSIEQLVEEALPPVKKSTFRTCKIETLFTDGKKLLFIAYKLT